MESVLDSDFSDPDLLSKTISKMTSNIKIGLNNKLNAHFLHDHYVHIDSEETEDIIDIETSAVNAASFAEEYVIVDEISDFTEEIVDDSIIEFHSSNERVMEEMVEQIPVAAEEVIEEAVEQPLRCSVDEENVEEEVIEIVPGMGQEIIADFLDKAPNLVEENEIDNHSTVAEGLEKNIVEESPEQFLMVETGNAMEFVTLPHVENSISAVESEVPYCVEEEVVSMPVTAYSAQSDLEVNGIVAEDMNSLFEQFESQGSESKTGISILPDSTSCSNSPLLDANQEFLHSAKSTENNISKNIKNELPIVTLQSAVQLIGTTETKCSPKYVIVTKNLKDTTKKTTTMVSLLGPSKSGPSMVKKAGSTSQTLLSNNKLPLQTVQQLSTLHNLATAYPNRSLLKPKSLDAAQQIFYTAQSDLDRTHTDSKLPEKTLDDEIVFEEVDITQVPEAKTEIEVGCDNVDPKMIPRRKASSNRSLPVLTHANTCDIFDTVEMDLLAKPTPFLFSKRSSKCCSPEPSAQPKQDMNVLDKLPGYMTDLSAGIPLDDSAATLASSALLDGSACSALLHRDPSPDREAESVILQYNRLPNYCSELNAGTCHSSPDGVMSNKAKDYFHSRSKHSSRTHSHKHSRHHRSRKRSKFREYSSSGESSDDDLLRVRRRKRSSSSSSSSSSGHSSASSVSFSDSNTSTHGSCPSSRHKRRSRSSPRHKNHRSKCRRHILNSRKHQKKKSMHKSCRRHKEKCKKRRYRSEDDSETQESRSSSLDNSRLKGRSFRRSRSSSSSVCSMTLEEREQEEKKLAHERAMAERRVVYVGGISNKHTPLELRERFGRFGEIETTAVHFRLRGDNYGFVTYTSSQDAQRAITNGNKVPGPTYNLCYGGRRIFCKTDYADLDGCTAVKEEWALHEMKREQPAEDFDALLQQTLRKIK
ncbi:protein SON-like isoform X2 [Watersipora subatra]|uniref:protein SON-like isoform X2 n=1 Tax=Watersipora subatra TaxID=2589382 RepID=UPI00355BB939